MNMSIEGAPIDDMLVFHIVFCRTIPEVSLYANTNLGYTNCIFRSPVYPEDTLFARSQVIGLDENSDSEAGTVYVRSQSRNQHGDMTLGYVCWALIPKHSSSAEIPKTDIPQLPNFINPKHFILSPDLNFETYET